MPVLFGGYSCASPRPLFRSCAENGLSTAWASLPNAYRCPIGTSPGEGWLLLSLATLKQISSDLTFPDRYELKFTARDEVSGETTYVTLPGMVVLGAECLSPGARNDDAAYLVRIADVRHLLARQCVDEGYNLRHRLTKAFLPATLNDGDLWTWSEVVEDLWMAAPLLGDYPGLPFEPDGLPEDLECWQQPVTQALGMVLDRLACELAYNPAAGTFGITRSGAVDENASAALALFNSRRHWDGYSLLSTRGSVPESVRVCFKRVPHVRGDGSPWYPLDLSDPTEYATPGVQPDTVAILFDDMAALYDAIGGLTNADELAGRAAERVSDFYRSLWSQINRMRLIYPGALKDSRLFPGSQIDAIEWREKASDTLPEKGCVTEIFRSGPVPRPVFDPATLDPLEEVLRLTGEEEDGLLGAYIQAWEPATQTWVDRALVWVKDANE